VPAPGVTSRQSAGSEAETASRPVRLDGLACVLGAARPVPAPRRSTVPDPLVQAIVRTGKTRARSPDHSRPPRSCSSNACCIFSLNSSKDIGLGTRGDPDQVGAWEQIRCLGSHDRPEASLDPVPDDRFPDSPPDGVRRPDGFGAADRHRHVDDGQWGLPASALGPSPNASNDERPLTRSTLPTPGTGRFGVRQRASADPCPRRARSTARTCLRGHALAENRASWLVFVRLVDMFASRDLVPSSPRTRKHSAHGSSGAGLFHRAQWTSSRRS